MLLLRAVPGAAANRKCSLTGIRSFSNHRRLLDSLRPASHLTTSDGRMSKQKSMWKPYFKPVEDTHTPIDKQKCLLRIVSYNILAQAYVKSASFPHSPRSCLRWKNRSEAVISRLLALDADLLCIQELDEYHTFYKDLLDKEGYGSVYVQRGSKKRDGCGIFFRRTRVSLLAEELVDYNDLVPSRSPPSGGAEAVEDSSDDDEDSPSKERDMNDMHVRLKRDCVGILAVFRPVEAPDHIFVLANTHIFWDPDLMDVKLAQVQYLLKSFVAFKERIAEEFEADPLLLITGDFNSLPGDPVYNYLVSGRKELVKQSDMEVGEVDEKFPKCAVRCPAVQHLHGEHTCPLPLVSLYAHIKEEPPFTNYTPTFVGTLDYILFVPSERWKPRTLLTLPGPGAGEVQGGLPNNSHPSDHLPIGCDIGLYY